MSFLFTNPLLLAALAGLGIPVIIHLLLKRKSPRLRFSTVRFFQKQDEQASSKRKLRNLLLLLLRLLVFALLVLAFARPYLPFLTNPATARQPRAVVVVLDHSASLQANDGAGLRWNQARKAVRELLAGLGGEDRAALVVCGGGARVAAGFGPASVITQVLEGLLPGNGDGELSLGLREAVRLVEQRDPKFQASLVVVSDFQRVGAQNLGSAPVPAGLEVKLVAVGDLAAPNVAVVDLHLDTANDALPHAIVANHGDEKVSALETELRVDGALAFERTLSLVAGGVTNLELILPVLKPGWHSTEFRVKARDPLALDDVRFATCYTPEPVRVLVVEGRRSQRSFSEPSFFVAAALDPAFGTTNVSHSAFALQKVGPDELAGLLHRSPTNGPEVVLLPAQKSLPGGVVQAVQGFVKAGGGLMLWVGDEINVSRFNADFSEVSPAVLRAVETADEPEGWHLGEHDKEAAMFASFRLPDSGNLALPGFQRRFTLTPMANSRVRARFEDGIPLLLDRDVGRGRVVLANTSADTAWSDWPKRKSFVPWLHDTTRFLSGRGPEAAARSGAEWLADAGEDLELGPSAFKTEFRLAGPDGHETKVTADAQGRLDLNLTTPGVYSLRDTVGNEVRRWAVNVPASESDLAALRPEEFQQQLVRVPEAAANPLGVGLFGPSRNQREFWRVLLLGALVLLVGETILSNRSYA